MTPAEPFNEEWFADQRQFGMSVAASAEPVVKSWTPLSDEILQPKASSTPEPPPAIPEVLSDSERDALIAASKAKISALELRLDSVASEMQRTLVQDNSVEHILAQLKKEHERLKELLR